MASDKEKREEILRFKESFEKRHNVKIPMTKRGGHRPDATTKGHRQWGAADLAISHLKPKLQNKFIKFMAGAGFRTIDERHIPSENNPQGKGIVHVDLGVKGRSKGTIPGKNAPGTMLKENIIKKRKGNDYPLQGIQKQQYFNPEKKEVLEKRQESLGKKMFIDPLAEIMEAPSSMELMSLEKIPTQQVDEVVNRSPASKQIPEETIKKVKDELKVPGEQDRIQNNAKTGQNKQPMDQLKEAFMYFGPQILTSILVGPEAGAKTGELLKGYRQDLLKQQALAKKEEITPYQRESLDRQDRRMRLERDKMKDIQKRSDKRFGYRQEENIAKQMGKEAAFDRGMHQLNRMEKILSKNPAGFTGKIDAIKQKAAQEIGGEDPNFTAFQQAVTDFGSQYIKEISGAQVSDAERKRLDEALPSVWAQESVNMSRIKGIKNLMLAIKDRNDRIKARLGGAIPKGMKLKDFFKPGDELDVDSILKGKSKKQDEQNRKESLVDKYYKG